MPNGYHTMKWFDSIFAIRSKAGYIEAQGANRMTTKQVAKTYLRCRTISELQGSMAEWVKALVLKTSVSVSSGTVGSNPTASA